MPETLLEVEDLSAGYGDFQALHGISFTVGRGELLALIGANGAGKSTLLKTVCGLVRARQGRVTWKGVAIAGLAANDIVRRGIAMVPEGRRLFPSLTVEENLVLGGSLGRHGTWSLESVYGLFPVLGERRHMPSTSLSGGQQQMVAIGRALMSNPELLLLDELSLGLAPVVIRDIYAMLPKILGGGTGAILVEQDVTRALAVARRFICLQEGRVSLAGEPRNFSRAEISSAYFGT
jgi:branched-chain amino acid transport system ATP-binding protein